MRYSDPRIPRVALVGLCTVLGVLYLGIIFSCSPPGGQESAGLTIVISASSPRTLVPNVDMNASSYVVAGTGPGGATFSTTMTSGATTTISALAPGAWTVTASGKNAAGTLITYGSAPAQVSTGTASTVNISVTPIVGPGSLSLTVTWPAASVIAPSLKAQLLPSTGSPATLTFSPPSNGSASYSGSGIMNGYFTLTLQLYDGATLVMGAVDVVEIVQGQTTSGTYAFSAVNSKGSIAVNITPNLLNPLTVTMSGQPLSAVGPGSAVTLGANVAAGTGNVTYAWYVNGVAQTLGSSLTLNSSAAPLVVGTYRVDVVAFTADGLRAGSATYALSVQVLTSQSYTTNFPVAENPLSQSGNWIEGQAVGLDWNNVLSTPGLVQGQGPSSVAYADPTAILAGTWGANQTAQATVYSVNQTASYYQEVELRLRSSVIAHSITGYEITFRCLQDANAYMQIVRWNGPLGSFTYLNSFGGAQYGVKTGDIVKATIVGNLITVYKNGVVLGTATDSTYATGSPGIGFDYGCGSTYGDFGFTSFTASSP
jgi:hypothetical protein